MRMTNLQLPDRLRQYFEQILQQVDSISFIGLQRGCGKTTAIKRILQSQPDRCFGLTSIGSDHLPKSNGKADPARMYVQPGTLVATARQTLPHCDATREILASSDIQTPLGEIILFRTLSAGHVFLAGPSRIQNAIHIKQQLLAAGAQTVLIDGAVDRKSSAVPQLADGVFIISKHFDANFSDPENAFAHQIRMLQTPACYFPGRDQLSSDLFQRENTLFLIDEQGEIHFGSSHEDDFALMECIQQLPARLVAIGISGAVTENSIRTLLSANSEIRNKLRQVQLIAEDATKFFLDFKALQKLTAIGMELCVFRPIQVFGLWIKTPETIPGNEDMQEWITSCSAHFQLPVLTLTGGWYAGI